MRRGCSWWRVSISLRCQYFEMSPWRGTGDWGDIFFQTQSWAYTYEKNSRSHRWGCSSFCIEILTSRTIQVWLRIWSIMNVSKDFPSIRWVWDGLQIEYNVAWMTAPLYKLIRDESFGSLWGKFWCIMPVGLKNFIYQVVLAWNDARGLGMMCSAIVRSGCMSGLRAQYCFDGLYRIAFITVDGSTDAEIEQFRSF